MLEELLRILKGLGYEQYIVCVDAFHQGVRALLEFPNNYKASIIRLRTSMYGLEGPYELAVLGPDDAICEVFEGFSDNKTKTVRSYLDETALAQLLYSIEHYSEVYMSPDDYYTDIIGGLQDE